MQKYFTSIFTGQDNANIMEKYVHKKKIFEMKW